jgi:hypothetical protein
MTLSPNLNVKKVRKTIGVQIKQEMVEKNERGIERSGLVIEYVLLQFISAIVQQKDRFEVSSVKYVST